VSESDVQLAAASNAIVIGFHVRVSPAARELAQREGVEIDTYEIIYEAIEAIRGAMEGLLEKKVEERVLGTAEVREVFRTSKAGTIIGSQVTDGQLKRNAQVRVIRNDQVVHTGKIDSLRRFKDDVKEVNAGLECGVGIENYQDVKPGDIIEAFEMVEVAQTL
jgi:translation initiation factor IF-2